MGRPFGTRERDGVLETLLFCAWRQSDSNSDPRYFSVDWHTLNLETREISPNLGTMPPEARQGTSAVAWLNRVYVLGGCCSRDPSCPDGVMNKTHFHNSVFCFDFDQPHRGWKAAPPMLFPRMNPIVVAAKGKIYAFGGSDFGHFAQVFDVSGSSWEVLSPPLDLDMDHGRVTYPVLFDSPRSRILLNFGGHLNAYHVDDKSWECINENLDFPPSEAALVDNVLYYLVDEDLTGAYCFSDRECSLKAYDVVENKMLPVKWLSKFSVDVSNFSLFHSNAGIVRFMALNEGIGDGGRQ
ncbi:hypothetical protein V6N13_110146 [Hibiscus sabdariffa]